MVVTERFRRIKERAIGVIDTVVTACYPDSGFVWTETYRRNRDGATFSIKTHNRGGEYGLLIYLDGTVAMTGNSSILYRIDPAGKIMDRIEAGKPPKGYLFIPQNDWDRYRDGELREILQQKPVIIGPGFNGMIVGAGSTPQFLSEGPHKQLLTKLSKNT